MRFIVFFIVFCNFNLYANPNSSLDKIRSALNKIKFSNNFYQGIPELGLIVTTSDSVKFQKIFFDPYKDGIAKVGKKGEGPNEFKAFPNIFSDGQYIYANDMGGKKLIVYDPLDGYKIIDIISYKKLNLPFARVVGKYKNSFIVLNLTRTYTKGSKRSLKAVLNIYKTSDFKNMEHLISISSLSKNPKQNYFKLGKLFLTGVNVVTVRDNGYIIINKRVNDNFEKSEIQLYSLNTKKIEKINFPFDNNLKKRNVRFGSFMGLDFNYYYVVYAEGEHNEVTSIVSTIDLIKMEKKQFKVVEKGKTIFGSVGDKLIVQNIVTEDINLEFVDKKRLLN